VQISWLSCGFEHCAALSSDQKVLTWGYGASGCLGHGDTNTYPNPTIINSLFEYNSVYIECGGYHSAIVTDEGEVFTWGRGDVH